MGLRFWRRERTEQATANPDRIKVLRDQLREMAQKLATEQLLTQILTGERDDARRELAEPCTQCAAGDVAIAYWIEDARAREAMRAKWEQMYRDKCAELAKLHTRTDDAERKLRGVQADLWMRDQDLAKAREQIAELASEAVVQADRIRVLEASLSGTRDLLRQEQRERARDAELLTPEVLKSAMRRLEIPGQREGEADS